MEIIITPFPVNSKSKIGKTKKQTAHAVCFFVIFNKKGLFQLPNCSAR